MKTHPSDSDNIPSIVINIFPYNNTFVIRSPWNDLFWLQLHISHHPWIMAHDPFWLSEAHGSEPSPYCTKRLQSVMFIVIKHIKDILNFILFSIFKTVILVFLEFKSEAGKNSRKFENILSVTTTVGVNLFVSLLSDSNRIKQQPLILISLG